MGRAGNGCHPSQRQAWSNTDEFLTLPEVAQLLKVAEQTAKKKQISLFGDLYPIGTDKKRRVAGVLARKKGLGG